MIYRLELVFMLLLLASSLALSFSFGGKVERAAAANRSASPARAAMPSEPAATFADRWYPPAPEGFYFCSLGQFRQQ